MTDSEQEDQLERDHNKAVRDTEYPKWLQDQYGYQDEQQKALMRYWKHKRYVEDGRDPSPKQILMILTGCLIVAGAIIWWIIESDN